MNAFGVAVQTVFLQILVYAATRVMAASSLNAASIEGRSDPPTPQSSIQMSQIGQLPPDASDLQIGDADHDGKSDVAIFWRDANFNFTYRFHELQKDGTYPEVYRGNFLDLLAMGDADSDGKTDLVGQPGNMLEIYESPSPTSYPSLLVWTKQDLSNNVGSTSIADTDRDGHMEVLHEAAIGAFARDLEIFENTGDNQYTQVYSRITHPGEMVIADLDGDGLTEIAYCGYDPIIGQCIFTVIESPADNTWTVTFEDTVGLSNGGGFAAGGRDTDGDGKPEVFLSGDDWDGQQTYHATLIYEAMSDNHFEKIATLRYHDLSTGGTSNALGQLDGVGREEYLMQAGRRLLVYRPVAPGEWTKVGEILDPGLTHNHSKLFDANGNGRDELFWPSESASTLVLEAAAVPPTDAVEVPSVGMSRMTVFPTPCSSQAVLRVSAAAAHAAARISVFDVAGRVVERRLPIRDAQGALLWPTRHLSAGVYFVRLEDVRGATLAKGRGIVVR